jgi:NAD(P)-dependent dehydrogenase (short-subunit alcohol dehydrogenase family)
MNRLQGKRAVVTGAASGIGRASARLFASEGAKVLACDVNGEGLAETVAAVRAEGGAIDGVVGSAAAADTVRGLVRGCVERFGGLDAFFANAGISGDLSPVLALEPEEFLDVLKVNLLAPFLAIRYAGEHMVEHGGGSIVCTASVAGLRSGAGGTPYSASKAGVVSLVQTAAWQLSTTGVRVNAVCPGLIETGMTKPLFDYARAAGKGDRLGQLNPLRRAGQPEEVAQVALFLASDESSYVNGQAWAVDGGLSASLPVVPGHMM